LRQHKHSGSRKNLYLLNCEQPGIFRRRALRLMCRIREVILPAMHPLVPVPSERAVACNLLALLLLN
jgi:hypothetical protein